MQEGHHHCWRPWWAFNKCALQVEDMVASLESSEHAEASKDAADEDDESMQEGHECADETCELDW